MRVLVTGGTGSIGPSVIDALLREGYAVRILARSRVSRPEVEVMLGDICDADRVTQSVAGCDAVVHLAAVLHETIVSPEVQRSYEDVNVGGTKNIVNAARQAGVRRIVFGSTIAVYGKNRGVAFEESTPLHPDNDYARSKVCAEELLMQQREVDVVILRFAAVYGPHVKGNYRRLVHALARHWFIPLGRQENRRALIFEDDVADSIVAALRAPQASRQVYNVAHPEMPTVASITKAISDALGRKSPRLIIPIWSVRAPVRVLERTFAALGLRPIITSAQLDKYVEDVTVSTDKIRRELGFIARYDISSGWKSAVRAMRGAGLL